MFAWGVEHELLPVTVYQSLLTVKGLRVGRSEARETKPVAPVSEEAVAAALPLLSPVLRAMVEFERLTGCRPSEVCELRPGDVDQSVDPWCYSPRHHKTSHHGRDRRIFIGPRGQSILRPYLDRGPDAFCFDPREAGPLVRMDASAPEDAPKKCAGRGIRLKRRRSRFTKDSYRAAVAKACRAAGVEVWTPNQLRHSRATDIRSTYGLEAAQTVLGHARADVTQIYAERDDALARRIMHESG